MGDDVGLSDRTIPDHVPRELVRDVDFYHLPGADADVHLAWRKVQQDNPDVFWTPRNGGHWIVTRASDIEVLQMDHELFSMAALSLPRVDMAGGMQAIP